jgi:hypothetical protein
MISETFWTIEQTYCIVTVTKTVTRFCEQSGQTVTSRGLRANSESLTVSVLNGDSLTVFCLTVSVLNGYRNGNTKSNSMFAVVCLRLSRTRSVRYEIA